MLALDAHVRLRVDVVLCATFDICFGEPYCRKLFY